MGWGDGEVGDDRGCVLLELDPPRCPALGGGTLSSSSPSSGKRIRLVGGSSIRLLWVCKEDLKDG